MWPDRVELRLLYGHLAIQTLRAPFLAPREVQSVSLNDTLISFTQAKETITLAMVTTIEEGQKLEITFGG